MTGLARLSAAPRPFVVSARSGRPGDALEKLATAVLPRRPTGSAEGALTLIEIRLTKNRKCLIYHNNAGVRNVRTLAHAGHPQKLSAFAWRTCGRSAIASSALASTVSSTPSSAIASPLFCSRPSAKVAMLMPSEPSLVPSAPM